MVGARKSKISGEIKKSKNQKNFREFLYAGPLDFAKMDQKVSFLIKKATFRAIFAKSKGPALRNSRKLFLIFWFFDFSRNFWFPDGRSPEMPRCSTTRSTCEQRGRSCHVVPRPVAIVVIDFRRGSCCSGASTPSLENNILWEMWHHWRCWRGWRFEEVRSFRKHRVENTLTLTYLAHSLTS